MSSGIYGRRLDQKNYLTGTVQTGGQLIGWEYPPGGSKGAYCWSFRRDITEFYSAEEVAGALTVKGLEGGSSVAMLRWNNVPMTNEELDAIEQGEGSILNPDFYGVGGNRQGQRLAVWRTESLSPVNIGYQGAQYAAALYYGYDGAGGNNGALIHYLQTKLGSSSTSLPGLQAEAAIAVGASSWNGVGEQLADL